MLVVMVREDVHTSDRTSATGNRKQKSLTQLVSYSTVIMERTCPPLDMWTGVERVVCRSRQEHVCETAVKHPVTWRGHVLATRFTGMCGPPLTSASLTSMLSRVVKVLCRKRRQRRSRGAAASLWDLQGMHESKTYLFHGGGGGERLILNSVRFQRQAANLCGTRKHRPFSVWHTLSIQCLLLLSSCSDTATL